MFTKVGHRLGAPPYFGKHVKPLVPAAFAIVSIYQSAWCLASIVEFKEHSQMAVIGDQNLLSRDRASEDTLSRWFQVCNCSRSIYQSALGPRGGLCPVFLMFKP
jgi:hypothetical protein